MTLESIIIGIPAILLALTVHEFAHGFVAFRCGDTTARDAGRLTLNPIAHLDPLGTLMMIGTYFFKFIPFGWAKPVPINPMNFGNPKRDIMLVSLAGPVSNILLALLCGGIIRILEKFVLNAVLGTDLGNFLTSLMMINLGLAFFNLIPVPPLDGSKVLIGLLPNKAIPGYLKNSNTLAIVFIILILLESWAHITTISYVLGPVWSVFYHFWTSIIFWKGF